MRLLQVMVLTIMCSISIGLRAADDLIDPCTTVVLAGDIDWVPYVVTDSFGVSGIGIDLASQVFTELDIEIKSQAFSSHMELVQALRTGDIDILVSTYPHNDVADVADLVQPAYMTDPITIAVKTSDIIHVTSWESLTGFHGVMDMTFTPDQESQDFFDVYLNIRDKLELGAALDAVINGHAYYILGSELQLRYAIKQNNLQGVLTVASQVSRPGSVYMAFRKASPCHQYAAFLTKRLQDYKNDGTVEKLVDQYVSSR